MVNNTLVSRAVSASARISEEAGASGTAISPAYFQALAIQVFWCYASAIILGTCRRRERIGIVIRIFRRSSLRGQNRGC